MSESNTDKTSEPVVEDRKALVNEENFSDSILFLI